MKSLSLFALIFQIVHLLSGFYAVNVPKNDAPKIAVIGAGIGGSSAAYFLRQLSDKLTIHVYEGNKVGGRLAVVRVGGHDYEAGGSVIHSKNKYMVDFTKSLELTHEDLPESVFGIYDGTDYRFKGSKWKYLTTLKLMWRYGIDLYNLKQMLNGLISNLSNIYRCQDSGAAFTSVHKMLHAMSEDFDSITDDSIADVLRKNGFHERFISELAEVAMRTNYGQSSENLHEFVGSVALAGAGDELWRVKEGNYRVPEKLLEMSGAKLIRSFVTTVELTLNESKIYKLTDQNENVDFYDVVIVAAPLTKDLCNIKFLGFPQTVAPVDGSYHRTVATFVEGVRNLSSINLTPEDNIDAVLTTANVTMFSSIGLQSPVNGDKTPDMPNVYKIFSNQELGKADLDKLFSKRSDSKVIDWLAYPQYRSPQTLQKFVLHEPGLYYTNAIEFSASAIEMSAIAGRNAALLAYNMLYGKDDMNDLKRCPLAPKSEM